MNIATPTNKIQLKLQRHQLLTLRGAKPRMSIACKEGVLWITNSNDNRDHIVAARGQFSPQRRGNVLIEAMRDASVDIEER